MHKHKYTPSLFSDPLKYCVGCTGALESLLLVTHRLGNILRASWHVVVDTMEQAATLLTRRAIARPRWSPSSLAEAELAAVEQNCVDVFQAVVRHSCLSWLIHGITLSQDT